MVSRRQKSIRHKQKSQDSRLTKESIKLRLFERIGRRLAGTAYIRRAMENPADLSAFRQRPTPRLLMGLILLGISYVLGWPAVSAFGAAALYLEEPLVFAIGGPAVYGFSWLVWAASMFLLGVEGKKYGGLFFRWAVLAAVKRMTGQGVNASSDKSADPDSNSLNRRE